MFGLGFEGCGLKGLGFEFRLGFGLVLVGLDLFGLKLSWAKSLGLDEIRFGLWDEEAEELGFWYGRVGLCRLGFGFGRLGIEFGRLGFRLSWVLGFGIEKLGFGGDWPN